eukprot:945045-Amphidinium_carterae.1
MHYLSCEVQSKPPSALSFTMPCTTLRRSSCLRLQQGHISNNMAQQAELVSVLMPSRCLVGRHWQMQAVFPYDALTSYPAK